MAGGHSGKSTCLSGETQRWGVHNRDSNAMQRQLYRPPVTHRHLHTRTLSETSRPKAAVVAPGYLINRASRPITGGGLPQQGRAWTARFSIGDASLRTHPALWPAVPAALRGAEVHCSRTLSSPAGSELAGLLSSPEGLLRTSQRYSGLSWLSRLRLRVACACSRMIDLQVKPSQTKRPMQYPLEA